MISNSKSFSHLQLIFIFFTAHIVAASPAPSSQPWHIDPPAEQVEKMCHPPIDPSLTQYIIGYGSLIQTASKDRTGQKAGDTTPVVVKGYQREWHARGGILGFGTTFLGASSNSSSSFLNGVIFQLLPSSGNITNTMHEYDLWEPFYCRRQVPLTHIQILTSTKNQIQNQGQVDFSNENETQPTSQSQYWIYETKPEFTGEPDRDGPIVQSYVDIFMSGCLEVQEKFQLKDYAKMCVSQTSGWTNEHWINDRIFPRRPWVHQPKAWFIDKTLKENIPQAFKNIKVEGYGLRVQ